MKSQSLLVAVFTALSAASAKEGNLRRTRMDMAENRIVGGQKVVNTGKKYPFFVATGQCGASLVAPDMVMSAAHCYHTIKGSVLVGAVNQNDANVGNAERRNIIPGTLVKHPKYNSNTQDYDMMLFKIDAVTKAHLKPVKLNSKNAVPSTGSRLTVIGTGALNRAGTKYEPHLKWVGVNAVAHKVCNKKYGNVKQNAMFCASAPGKDSCYGDSGGPLINAAGVQVGIVSWGADCADKFYPGVYSRVSGSIGWLQKTICEMSDYPDAQFCGSKFSAPAAKPVTFTAVVQYDRFSAQTGWYIKDVASGRMVVSMRKGSIRRRGFKLIKKIALTPGRKYQLVMMDKNGFIRGKKGFISLVGKRGARTVWIKKVTGKFKRQKKVPFSVPRL